MKIILQKHSEIKIEKFRKQISNYFASKNKSHPLCTFKDWAPFSSAPLISLHNSFPPHFYICLSILCQVASRTEVIKIFWAFIYDITQCASTFGCAKTFHHSIILAESLTNWVQHLRGYVELCTKLSCKD